MSKPLITFTLERGDEGKVIAFYPEARHLVKGKQEIRSPLPAGVVNMGLMRLEEAKWMAYRFGADFIEL